MDVSGALSERDGWREKIINLLGKNFPMTSKIGFSLISRRAMERRQQKDETAQR
jgi:hypothetical protein